MIKKIFMLAAAMIMSLPLLQAQESEGLKVMSYNIRLGSANDGTNAWPMRYPATLEMIEDQAPDVFGVQEALPEQVRFLEEFADGYDGVGVGSVFRHIKTHLDVALSCEVVDFVGLHLLYDANQRTGVGHIAPMEVDESLIFHVAHPFIEI